MTDKRSAGLRFALAAVLAVTLAELVVPAAPASARVCDALTAVVTATPSDRTEVLVSLPEALTRRAVPASALTVTEDGLEVPVLEFAPGSAAAIDVVVILDNSARSARLRVGAGGGRALLMASRREQRRGRHHGRGPCCRT